MSRVSHNNEELNQKYENRDQIFKNLSQTEYEKLLVCDRCHKKMNGNGRKINLTYLTNMATWHRKIDADQIVLCDSCCKELNEKIDNWLINNGKGIKEKFKD